MKLIIFYIIISQCLVGLTCCQFEADLLLNDEPNVIPALQEWEASKGFFRLSNSSAIVTDGADKSVVNTFAEDLKKITGIAVGTKSINASNGDIHIRVSDQQGTLKGDAYKISIGKKVVITAGSQAGAFYATQTLLQILKQDTLHWFIPKGEILDYPEIAQRAFMLDIGRKYFSMDYLKKTIRNMAWYKQNVFHMHFSDWSGFRLKSDKFPELASKQAYSKAEIRELQDYAKKCYVMIVPEIDLPAHATEILRYNPSFGFDCESMLTARWLPDDVNASKAGWILNVTKPEVRIFIADLLDEFIPLFDAPYFHIGGDEWQYDDQKMACEELIAYAKEKEFKYPGDVYVDWINQINKQVKSYGKTTQIWNWWRFCPSEKQQNKTELQPDNDIVINVWNQERQGMILKDGYKTILTPETGKGALYITPGLKGGDSGDYGVFDTKYNYEVWEPAVNEQILGYKICLWSDRAEDKEDQWFDQFADKPKAVFAEKMWGRKGSETIEAFFKRVESVGLVSTE